MSLLPKGHEGPLFHSRMIRPVVAGGGWTRGQTGVSQRAHVGFLRSRPPAHPPPHQPSPGGSASATPPQGGSDCPGSAGVPPAYLSRRCSSVSRRVNRPTARPKPEPWRRSRLTLACARLGAGGTPALPGTSNSSRHRHTKCRSILVPLVLASILQKCLRVHGS